MSFNVKFGEFLWEQGLQVPEEPSPTMKGPEQTDNEEELPG
jgi:hypothetical protein